MKTTTSQPPSRPHTILAVDDSKALRNFIQKALRPFACEMSEATNGFNAFFAIERARPDLVLLDVNMPIMDGVEALSRIRATPELQAIPVIMLTSPADHADIAEITALGVSGMLVKPFNETALLEKIRGVIDLTPVGPTERAL